MTANTTYQQRIAELPELPKPLVAIDQSDDEFWGELQEHAWDSDYASELRLNAPLFTTGQTQAYALAAQDKYAAPLIERIKELEKRVADYVTKRDVAVSTLEIVKKQRTAAQKALAEQCKETQRLEKQNAELREEIIGLRNKTLREAADKVRKAVVFTLNTDYQQYQLAREVEAMICQESDAVSGYRMDASYACPESANGCDPLCAHKHNSPGLKQKGVEDER